MFKTLLRFSPIPLALLTSFSAVSQLASAQALDDIPAHLAEIRKPAQAPSSPQTKLLGQTIEAPGGLAVVLGKAYPQVAEEIGAQGYWLVRGYTADAGEGRKWVAATEKSLPLSTVQVLPNTERIPLLDATVNVVVYDPASGFSEEEAMRILAPKGVMLTGSGRSYKKTVKPEDERYDDWTHHSANQFGTNSNKDTAVAPSNTIRFSNQSFVSIQVRSVNGTLAYIEDPIGFKHQGDRAKKSLKTNRLIGVDANSGVVLWEQFKTLEKPFNSTRLGYVAHSLGFIHPQAETMSPFILTDRLTGKTKVTYDQGIRFPKPNPNDPNFSLSEKNRFATGGEVSLLVHGDKLIQIHSYEVAVLDVPTGKLLWKKSLENPASRGSLSPDGKRLYIQEIAKAGKHRGKIKGLQQFARWGSMPTMALASYDLASGKLNWRNDSWSTMERWDHGERVKGPANLSQLIEINDILYAYDHVSNIGSDAHGDLFAIDIKTGKILWHNDNINRKNPKREWRKHGAMTNNLVYWKDNLVVRTGALNQDGPENVEIEGRFGIGTGGNQRCVRSTASENFLIRGHTGYLAKDGTGYQTFLTRGNCAMPNYPTHGAVMSVTDETCACYNGLRGNVALVPPKEFKPVANTQRLSKPAPLPVTAAATAALPNTPLTKSMIQYFPMRIHWNQKKLGPYSIGGGISLTHDIQRHVVTATKGGNVLWRYRADGRVYSEAMQHGGLLYVPSAAGTLTALDPTSGKIQWRFLAAPSLDQVVINGQVESRWPVANSVIHNGILYVAAGIHSETDGGIYLWGLNPKTGAIQNQSNIYAPISKFEAERGIMKKHPQGWRADRAVATITTVNLGGVAVTEDGRFSIINRRWNGAVRASLSGFWHHLNRSTGKRTDDRWPNPQEPYAFLMPFDPIKYNGQRVLPVDVFGTVAPNKNQWGDYVNEDGSIKEVVVEKAKGKKKKKK